MLFYNTEHCFSVFCVVKSSQCPSPMHAFSHFYTGQFNAPVDSELPVIFLLLRTVFCEAESSLSMHSALPLQNAKFSANAEAKAPESPVKAPTIPPHRLSVEEEKPKPIAENVSASTNIVKSDETFALRSKAGKPSTQVRTEHENNSSNGCINHRTSCNGVNK